MPGRTNGKLIAKKNAPGPRTTRVHKNDYEWVVLRWPTPAMAQQAGMSTEALSRISLFKVCTLDYRKLQPGHESA
jgi:leucyl aminopeptidase (aminopeptidase T)